MSHLGGTVLPLWWLASIHHNNAWRRTVRKVDQRVQFLRNVREHFNLPSEHSAHGVYLEHEEEPEPDNSRYQP